MISSGITLFKDNKLIRSNVESGLSVYSSRLFDYIQARIQKELNFNEDNYFNERYSIEFSPKELETILNIEKQHIKKKLIIIENLFKDMVQPFKLKHYTKEDIDIEWGFERILYEAEKRKNSYYISVDKFMLGEIIKMNEVRVFDNKGNFTFLELKKSNSFNSVKTSKLYQYLKLIENLPTNNIPLSNTDMNKMFNVDNKYMSKNLDIIKQCMKQINKLDIVVEYKIKKVKGVDVVDFIFIKNTEDKSEKLILAKNRKDNKMIDKMMDGD